MVLFLPILISLVTPPLIYPFAIFSDQTLKQILFDFRIPRYTLAILIGANLAVSGASFQSLLKNPLADPYILGISGGSALGYVFGILLNLHFTILPILAFACGLLTILGLYQFSKTKTHLNTIHLLLMGVIFNSFSFALILLINSLVSFGQAQQILFLLLGNLEAISWPELLFFASTSLLCHFFLIKKSKELNLLSLGVEDANHLGLSVKKSQAQIFILSSYLVGLSVSYSGLIGFIGLFVPHLVRLVFGSDHRVLIPASLIIGGLTLAFADFFARHLFYVQAFQTRIPVGVITALIGAPLFVWFLKSRKYKL